MRAGDDQVRGSGGVQDRLDRRLIHDDRLDRVRRGPCGEPDEMIGSGGLRHAALGVQLRDLRYGEVRRWLESR